MMIQISVKDGDIIVISGCRKYTVNVLRQAVEPYLHYDKFILSDEDDNNLSDVFYDVNVLSLFKDGMVYYNEQHILYAPKGTVTAEEASWIKEYMTNICIAIKKYEQKEL